MRVAIVMLSTVLALCADVCAQPGLTLVYLTRRVAPGSAPFEDGARLTVYIQGQKLRAEYNLDTPLGASVSIVIQRCDKGRAYHLIPATKHYFERSFSTPPGSERLPATLRAQSSTSAPPNYDVEVTLERLAETKQAFGYTARRYSRKVVETPARKLGIRARRTEESIWFLEVPFVSPCYAYPLEPKFSTSELNRSDVSQIRTQFRRRGKEPEGVELSSEQKISVFMQGTAGEEEYLRHSITTIELQDLKQGPLDSALFEIPRGYKLVK